MNAMLLVLGRLVHIILGYACAALASSAFIHLLFLGSAGFGAEEAPFVIAGSLVFSVPFVALFVAYFAFIPSAALILVGELLNRRDWLFHAIAGGVAGAAVAYMMINAASYDFDLPGGDPGRAASPDTVRFWLLMTAGGMVGGYAYWCIAGRYAGSWRGPAE